MPTQQKPAQKKSKNSEPGNVKKSSFSVRPPIVVIMGHIDHGKSTLLDYIRKTNTVGGEAGGITQHIGAYEVEHTIPTTSEKSKITFIDTPGHEAFSSIRQRGARVADIAILVVSAEDGVKPQTLEAHKSVLEAKIPYIVAINKIDKPAANIERVKQNLAENEIYLEGSGGDVPFVPISALTGAGVPELLDMIMLVAEVADLKADESKPGCGVVIEAHLDNKKGITATLIIQDGHIETGSYIVAEDSYSPVRLLENFAGATLSYATFSSPVKVVGWNKLPHVGATFVVVDSKKSAEEAAAENKSSTIASGNSYDKNSSTGYTGYSATFGMSGGMSNGISGSQISGQKIILPLIIKADAVGSLEGVKQELSKIKNDKVVIKIVTEGIGAVSESDVKTAEGDPAIIILAFNSKPDVKARNVLERMSVRAKDPNRSKSTGQTSSGHALNSITLREFSVIYELIEFVKNTIDERTPKEYMEESTGKAKILAIFSKAKDKQIIGGKVQEGIITVGSEVKILRRDGEIGRGRVRELQQQKVKASEIREGYDFGALIESKIEIAVGDKIEGFAIIEKK